MKSSLLLGRIEEECKLVGIDAEYTYRRTSVLLKLYRRIRWRLRNRFKELHTITYESCLGDFETLTYLLNFAPEKELDIFQTMAVDTMKTKVLLHLIDTAIDHVKEYPENGNLYYSIFDAAYLNQTKMSETEILMKLDLERSTYYRRKKEATYLLGFILFGTIMPDYLKKIPHTHVTA